MNDVGKTEPADTPAFDTLLAHAHGSSPDPLGGVVPPIYPSTTYLRGVDPDRAYIRDDNPGFLPAEAVLNNLEAGAGCMLFASGMAACTTPFLALNPGDHIVAPRVMYWGLRNWLIRFSRQWGLDLDFVPAADLTALASAIRPGKTRLIWLETPTNPTWEVTDIAAVAELAHRHGILLAVDSTTATPILTRPLQLGADLVIHSATKYLNGHSDVLAGAIVTARDDDFWQRLRGIRQDHGAVLGAFEAWLLLRGMRTLHLRVERACANAMHIAQHCQDHPAVAQVLYPGLTTHLQHEVAARQMRGGFGGMLSLRMKAGREAALHTAASTRWFRRATSLGGVESLIEHRAGIEGPGSHVPEDLLRLSVGVEAVADLIADLDSALI